jgi:site-specific recombinase XerD
MAKKAPVSENAVIIPAAAQQPAQTGGYADWLADFLAAQDITPGSRATYKSALSQFFQWLIENPPAGTLSRETILQYKEFLAKKGLQTFTRANYVVAVRRFFEWTESTLKYPNIAKGVKGVRRSTKIHHKHALTTKQIMQLLASIKNTGDPVIANLRDYALINLLFRTGLRLIEIKRATIADLELRAQDAILWIHGKGREGKDEFIVVPHDALTPITEYLAMRKPGLAREPLFASLSDRNFGKQITTNSLSRIIKQRLRMAGMDSRRITAHSLRHTFGVMAITAGASLYDVQLAMRHTSPATTEIYLGDIEQEKRLLGGAEQRVDELFKKLSENN